MKNKLVAIMFLLLPFHTFGKMWHSIEYLSSISRNKLIKFIGSEKYISIIPLENGERAVFSAYFGDDKVVIITEKNIDLGTGWYIKMYDKTSKILKEISPCSIDWGTIVGNCLIGLVYDKANSKYNLMGYDLSNGDMTVIGDLPILFFSQGREKSIGYFQLNVSEKLVYINLVDLSDWKKTGSDSFLVYDFGHDKVILDEPGKLLFENASKGGTLFLSKAQGLYVLNPNDFSAKPIELKNIKIKANQSITLLRQCGDAVILCITSKKPSVLAKIIDGTGFILRHDYFEGTFKNNSIVVNAKIKELPDLELNQIILN